MPCKLPDERNKNSTLRNLRAGVVDVCYILNFLDRTIIYILFPLIKKEMAFSDTQLALLGTTSFVIFYTLLGIPFGRLADKGSRTKIIAVGVAVWSLLSAICLLIGRRSEKGRKGEGEMRR